MGNSYVSNPSVSELISSEDYEIRRSLEESSRDYDELKERFEKIKNTMSNIRKLHEEVYGDTLGGGNGKVGKQMLKFYSSSLLRLEEKVKMYDQFLSNLFTLKEKEEESYFLKTDENATETDIEKLREEYSHANKELIEKIISKRQVWEEISNEDWFEDTNQLGHYCLTYLDVSVEELETSLWEETKRVYTSEKTKEEC